MAQVDAINRLSRATPPAIGGDAAGLRGQITLQLLLFDFLSSKPGHRHGRSSDYAARNVQPELQRLPGIGQVQLFGPSAPCIWIDPAKLTGSTCSLPMSTAAIRAQTPRWPAGALATCPTGTGGIHATVVVHRPAQHGGAVWQHRAAANPDGSTVRLKMWPASNWAASPMHVGAAEWRACGGHGRAAHPDRNACRHRQRRSRQDEELSPISPKGVKWTIPTTAPYFVDISIGQVVKTLLKPWCWCSGDVPVPANWRYTIIPTIVVPIALLGTFGRSAGTGHSINVLTMFGMVLVIGIVVDDAIVVVEKRPSAS